MSTAMTQRTSAPLTVWTPSFAMSVDEAVEQVRMKREFMQRVMVEGVHYGPLPGTRADRKCLFKPGAELLLAAMGLHPALADAAPPTLDITGRDHNGEPFIEHRRACTIYRQTGPAEHERMVVAQAEGSCSSWEVKYRYRDAKPQCPQCGLETIGRSKEEYGGGWYCNRKAGGCGTKFDNDDPSIIGQKLGRVNNPEVADIANTILKMADKRAVVAATLLATGCSDIFTQDIVDEDDPGAGDEESGSRRRTTGTREKAQQGGQRSNGPGATDEQRAELEELNQQVDEKKRWAPAVFEAKVVKRPNGYELSKAELLSLLPETAEATA